MTSHVSHIFFASRILRRSPRVAIKISGSRPRQAAASAQPFVVVTVIVVGCFCFAAQL
jgi:hypothetical protein